METDDPGVGSKQDRLESNVVRFPRDWLGPLEELVPIGPSGGQQSDSPPDHAADDQPTPAERRVVDFPPSAPLRADAFWGEDSASIHDALEPPARPARTASASAGACRRPAPRLRRWISMHLPREIDPARARMAFTRRWSSAAQRRGPAVPRRPGHRAQVDEPVRRPMVRRWEPTRSFAVLSAVALAMLGAAFAFISVHGASSRHLASRAGSGGLAVKAFASLPSDVNAVGSLGGRHLSVPQPAAPHRHSHSRPRLPTAGAATYVGASTETAAPAPAAASPTPAPVYAGSRQTSSSPTSDETPVPTETQPQHSSGGGSTENSPPSTPASESSKRPAFGANGLLGPGSSPAS